MQLSRDDIRVRAVAMACLGAMAFGCFATHEPPPVERDSPPFEVMPLTVAAEYAPIPRDVPPGLEAEFRKSDAAVLNGFVADLRATGVFQCVGTRSELATPPDLVATRLPHREDPESYCGETTLAFLILTGGVAPARDCARGYSIRFTGPHGSLELASTWEADTWIGWIPLFWNVREDWHWYGPPDEMRRIDYLRRDLGSVREWLLWLARAEE